MRSFRVPPSGCVLETLPREMCSDKKAGRAEQGSDERKVGRHVNARHFSILATMDVYDRLIALLAPGRPFGTG